MSRRTDREGGERSVEGGREDGMAGSVVQSLGWERKMCRGQERDSANLFPP